MKLHTPLAVACLLAFSNPAQGQQQNPAQQGASRETTKPAESSNTKLEPAQDADLIRLVELIGAPQASAQLAQQSMAIKKQFTPKTLALTDWRRDTFQSSLERKIQSRITPAAVSARWSPILARHFTPQEIKAIVQFYESTAGRKFLAEQSTILRESFAAMEEWRLETITEILKEMEVEFPGARETEQAMHVTSRKP